MSSMRLIGCFEDFGNDREKIKNGRFCDECEFSEESCKCWFENHGRYGKMRKLYEEWV